jgi:anti-anti-sigma factor
MRLAGEATIYTVKELHREICAALADCTELEVNLAAVSDMDTAGVQQLILAKRESVRLGTVLHLVQPSPAMRDVLALYHLAAYFGASLVDTAVTDSGEGATSLHAGCK